MIRTFSASGSYFENSIKKLNLKILKSKQGFSVFAAKPLFNAYVLNSDF